MPCWLQPPWLAGRPSALLLKIAFDRQRPDIVHTARVFTANFPSRHAMLSAVIFLSLGVLLAKANPDPRVKTYFVSLAVFLTVMVGLRRIYLGVHYPRRCLQAGASAPGKSSVGPPCSGLKIGAADAQTSLSCRPVMPHDLPFVPNQHHDDRVEDGQDKQAERMGV